MTALFDLGATECSDAERAQRVLDEAKADHGFTVALDHARSLGGRTGLRRLQSYTRQIAAVEGELLHAFVGDDGDTRRAERQLDDGKTSRSERRKKAARAKAIAKNPDLGTKLAGDELGEEQLDVIADAADKTNGEAAADDELIDKVAAAPPEQARNIAREYVANRATKDGIQTEHDRQRALRRASKFNNKRDGLDTIMLAGDGIASKNAWQAIQKRADEIYQRDGGSGLPDREHPRTREQRLFDAAHELLTGTITTPSGRTIKPKTKKKNPTRSTARPQIVLSLTIDKPLGLDPAAVATQHGFGLIPDSILANYAADADFLVALYDRAGEPLWLARLNRYATPTQMIALILRDRGCVLCGADHTRCQAHHTMPWNAPAKGNTDLDLLALLCQPCHRKLHADNHTLYQDTHGHWQTRPATPDETPHTRPTTTRNTIRRE